MGHVVFASVLVAVGAMGLVRPDFAPVWQPPDDLPARTAIGHVCALIFAGCGIGLLVPRVAGHAARVLTLALVAWLIAFRIRDVIGALDEIGAWYSCAEMVVVLAASWLLYARFAASWDRRHLPAAIGPRAIRSIQIAYGLALIPFGLAHFLFMERTIAMVPSVMPAPAFWAWATGIAFFAAALAIVTGVLARLAATLVAIQIGGFTATVFWPFLTAQDVDPFLWNEFAVSVVLAASAWVIAESSDRVPRGARAR